MIELIKLLIVRTPTFEEKMRIADRLYYNYFRQMINRTSDGYYEIDKLKEKDFNTLLGVYLKSKVKEDVY